MLNAPAPRAAPLPGLQTLKVGAKDPAVSRILDGSRRFRARRADELGLEVARSIMGLLSFSGGLFSFAIAIANANTGSVLLFVCSLGPFFRSSKKTNI